MNSMHQNSENCNPAMRTFTSNMFGDMRVVEKDGEIWFVLADVCANLDIRTNDAMNGLDEDEKGYETVVTPGGPQQMAIINEPGLYSLILRSRKPEAKAFKRWICHEVLPSIRKNGVYVDPVTQPSFNTTLDNEEAFVGPAYGRLSYAKTLREMARLQGLTTDQRLILMAKAACTISGESIHDILPAAPSAQSTLKRRILTRLDKVGGHASARDIYAYINGYQADEVKSVLLALERSGELISTTVRKNNGREQKIWMRPDPAENAH